MNNEVICVATFTAKTGKSDALCKAMSDLVEPTRREAGCLSYTLNQSLNNPNIFTMLERFKNQDAFDLHSKESYLLNFKNNILNELVESNSISVTLYNEVSK